MQCYFVFLILCVFLEESISNFLRKACFLIIPLLDGCVALLRKHKLPKDCTRINPKMRLGNIRRIPVLFSHKYIFLEMNFSVNYTGNHLSQ